MVCLLIILTGTWYVARWRCWLALVGWRFWSALWLAALVGGGLVMDLAVGLGLVALRNCWGWYWYHFLPIGGGTVGPFGPLCAPTKLE